MPMLKQELSCCGIHQLHAGIVMKEEATAVENLWGWLPKPDRYFGRP
jgi:hypothetical protein